MKKRLEIPAEEKARIAKKYCDDYVNFISSRTVARALLGFKCVNVLEAANRKMLLKTGNFFKRDFE